MKHSYLLLCASMALLAFTAQANQCPDRTGSYRFTGAEKPFYLVKVTGQPTYNAFFPNDAGRYVYSQTIYMSAEKLKAEQFPECALLIEGIGLLVKSKKGEKVNVMTQSQNYTTEKIITTDYGLIVFSGFAWDFVGVDKLSAQVPAEAKNSTLPQAGRSTE